jgi:hypothetical protein
MYIAYPGLSAITPLTQGLFYIHAVLYGSEETHWYSDDFKCGFYNNVISVSFRNSKSFGNLWMHDFYWKASYTGINYDTGEFDQFDSVRKDIDNHDIFTYRRKDKIRALSLQVDSNGLDAMNMAAMCSDVLITDEIGLQWNAEILGIEPTPIAHSYYHNLIVKYRVVADSIVSVNKIDISLYATQIGVPDGETPPVVVESEGNVIFNGPIVFDKPIVF